MAKTIITMKKRNETKGAVRYEEEGLETNPLYLIGTLYLRKAGLVSSGLGATAYPERIVVIVAENDPAT